MKLALSPTGPKQIGGEVVGAISTGRNCEDASGLVVSGKDSPPIIILCKSGFNLYCASGCLHISLDQSMNG